MSDVGSSDAIGSLTHEDITSMLTYGDVDVPNTVVNVPDTKVNVPVTKEDVGKWYSISYIAQYTTQYGRFYDLKIVYVSNNFLETYKTYLSKYLFTKYRITETRVHPESVPPQTLFNCPCHYYSLSDDRVRKLRNINYDEKTLEIVSTVERSLSTYMSKFIKHIHTKHSKCGLCLFGYCCVDIDIYFSNYKYKHSYDLDTDTITTTKRDRDDKMFPYTF